MARDVIVVVQRDALPKEKENLDILFISTTGTQPVKVYRDVPSVEAVYGEDGPTPNAKIVRKATTLLNQGKTTLADTLMNKFKIVGFEPPSAKPALPAAFTTTFPTGALDQLIEADQDLWVKFGGDDCAVIKLTAADQITTGAEFAALFANTNFTKGGKTYAAAVDGVVVRYTATEDGATDSIPEIVNIYTDEKRLDEFAVTMEAGFVNGSDAMSAPDVLIEEIKRFQQDEDNDWYYFMTDRDEPEFVRALAKFAEASEPSEAELGVGVEDPRKFYMGQTADKNFVDNTARAAVIYTNEELISEEPDASYTGNVGPFYPKNVTWKFKRPQDGNAPASAGSKLISLPKLTEGERDQLIENHINF